MSTLGDARMSTLRDKIENLKEGAKEKTVKVKKIVVGASKRSKVKVKKL